MGTLFYIIYVIFTGSEWSWWWFLISLLFSGGERVVYRYTSDRSIDGEEVND